jgi:predicted membrane-bound spermidine synthase
MASPSRAWFILPVGEPDPRDSRPLRFPSAFALLANGSLLVLELVAGRILAPTVGVSIYTWTAVIGVVLAGISLGSWLGGKVADWRPARSILSIEFLLAALASALILVFDSNLDSVAASFSWPTIWQVIWLATIVFFLPSVLVGMVTPMIIKLSLNSLDATGRVVGRIRAAAEVGAIAGVFLTGFVLIDAFGTRTIVVTVAITLGVLAILSSPLWVLALGRSRRASAAEAED